jgi:O-antigen/teichoic acid export membrane protein
MGALGEPPLDEVFAPLTGGEDSGGIAPTEQRVLRSTIASYAIQFARLGINFGAKLALIRLILPEGHGIYELALRIVTVASAIRDLGLPYHLVRDKQRPYGTVFAFITALGMIMTVSLMAIAPLFGHLAPELPLALRVFAIWVLLDGLAVVPRTFFERELTISSLVGPEIWRGVAIAVVSVGLALLGGGYWSFIVGDIVGALVLAVYSWAKVWGKISLKLELGLLPGLLRNSFTLFLIWLVLQLVSYIDAFIVRGFLDTATVGLYSRAYWLVFLVATFFYPRALFPALTEYRDDHSRLVEFFRLSTIQLLGCQIIGSYIFLFNADKMTSLFGSAWAGAVPILRVLAFVPFFDQFSMLGGELLKSRGKDGAWLFSILLNLASLVGFGVLFTHKWGAPGMAAANYFLLGNLVMGWYVGRIIGPRFKVLLGDLAFLYLIPLPLFVLADWLFPGKSWLSLLGSLIAGLSSFCIFVGRYSGSFKRFFGRSSLYRPPH